MGDLKLRNIHLIPGGVDLVIVPGLCFTTQGHRLGRGKGYYDQYLRKLSCFRKEMNLKSAVTVGLAFNEQIVATIPVAEFDMTIDIVLYPKIIPDDTNN